MKLTKFYVQYSTVKPTQDGEFLKHLKYKTIKATTQGESYRLFKEKYPHFYVLSSFADDTPWKRLKWKLFGETKFFYWIIALYILIPISALAALIGIIYLITHYI